VTASVIDRTTLHDGAIRLVVKSLKRAGLSCSGPRANS
jgi:hypothetical protein